MNSESSIRRSFPLRLCEVLEKEFITLHGPLTRPPTWLLHPDDIEAREFMKCLETPEAQSQASPLRQIKAALDAAGLVGPDTLDDRFATTLVDAINKALREQKPLYAAELLNTDAEARRLSEIYLASRKSDSNRDSTADAGAAEAGTAEHVLLNRLLLEAAFPPEVIAAVDSARLAQVWNDVHQLSARKGIRSALCLSGGGIRSAAFGLGALQGLARHDLLDKFDYLSTVSGGGYVGSWLSTWIHRHPQGLLGVSQALGAGAASGNQWSEKLDPAPDPVRFLRNYSHFLNAKAGFFSVDTWTWAGIYLRNLLLNWLVLIPLLLLLLAVPRLYAAFARLFESAQTPLQPWLFWLATLAAISVVVCAAVNRPSLTEHARHPDHGSATKPPMPRRLDRLRERMKTQKWIVALGLIPLLIFATLLTLVIWGLPEGRPPLTESQAYALLTLTPFLDLGPVVPFIALDNIVIWGELIVLAGWLVSIAILPGREWRTRVLELLAMLLAGLLTWILIGQFARFIAMLGDTRSSPFTIGKFQIYPLHLYVVLAVPALVAAALAGMTLFIGAVSKAQWIYDEDREWWGRFGAWLLIGTLGWWALSAIAVLGPTLLLSAPTILGALGGISGVVGVLLGKSALTPATSRAGQLKGALAALGVSSLAVVAAIFLAIFLAFLSLLSSALLTLLPLDTSRLCGADLSNVGPLTALPVTQMHLAMLCQVPLASIAKAIFGLIGITAAMSFAINLNKFSLHGAYRIRIARTFLGASRGADRRPNPFTGFDPLDNVYMHELQPGLLRESDLIDLKGLIEQLHGAAIRRTSSPYAAVLVELMCTREHDRHGLLAGQLRNYAPADPVLVSLQRGVRETLNRVLETAHLERAAPFQALMRETALDVNTRQALQQYVGDDNRIFANRRLLELAFPEHIAGYDFPPPPPYKLLHLINLTLNLVHGRNLAWQERKAAPFVVTPLHAGSYYLGYRPARDYGGEDGISIATATAVSGAAVSPNMGYSSSPITALLLTLFNVRLGWWLGNPGVAGSGTYDNGEPTFSLQPLLSEALGLTNDRSPYVYLSDGGHFDNMGLFEMVLRRCHLIVAVDAGADPEYHFDDLGNAVRKARIDLGIPIDFTTMGVHKARAPDDTSGHYCALGRIRYSAVDGAQAADGLLIYFKPVLCNREPRDVLHYWTQNPEFPQESTLDQFFGETQFESYRRLGEFAVDAACSASQDGAPSWLAGFVQSVRRHVDEPEKRDQWLDDWLERHAVGDR